MAIDDPVGIVIQQTEQESDADNSLSRRLVRLGLSAWAAVALANYRVASNIVTTLLTESPRRFEERIIRLVKAFEERLKQLEGTIPDKAYYESEEFQGLFTLLAERLHTTYQHEKLKMFGDALGNSGSSDFQTDPREDFIRMLRDLSLADLLELKLYAPLQPKGYFDAEKRFQMRRSHQGVEGERRSRATRLIGLGLVEEELHVKEDFSFTGSSQQEAIKAVAKALATPPARSYKLSRFGWRFLKFITGDEAAATGES
jgi:hypothetical protein